MTRLRTGTKNRCTHVVECEWLKLNEVFKASRYERGGELTLSLLVTEHCARALHVSLEELCCCDQTRFLCRRQTRRFGFWT